MAAPEVDMGKGKLIVFYGVNNLGKTTQAKLLVDKLNSEGKSTKYLKYPIYDLEPTGSILDEYLRQANPYNLSPKEAQIIYAFNRCQYQPALRAELEKGVNIVAEDYWATGVAWGMGAGIDKNFLLRLNSNFLREDLAFLFVGQRFATSLEADHLHENNEALVKAVDQAHRELAKTFGWKLIEANQVIETVSAQIFAELKKALRNKL